MPSINYLEQQQFLFSTVVTVCSYSEIPTEYGNNTLVGYFILYSFFMLLTELLIKYIPGYKNDFFLTNNKNQYRTSFV